MVTWLCLSNRDRLCLTDIGVCLHNALLDIEIVQLNATISVTCICFFVPLEHLFSIQYL